MNSICVIVSTWKHFADPFLHQPYWELYFATILRDKLSKENITVSVVDFRGLTTDEELREALEQISKSDLFIHWIFKTNTAIDHYKIAKHIKEKFPSSAHVAGGTHVEMEPDDSSKYFDSLIIGPGEEALLKIVEDIKTNNLKKVYQQSWKDVPFHDTPFPRRDFLPPERVTSPNIFRAENGELGSIVYFSRGCIYQCAFCTLNVPLALQVRKPELIKAEIEYLKENYQIRGVLAKDEVCIHPNENISSEIFQAIGECNVIWRGQTTVVASYDQLYQAQQSGCKELAVGIETVDDEVMKIINKNWQTQKKISNFLENAKKVGIKIKVCMILGLPGEPPDIVEKTIKFIEENEIEYSNVSGFCPMPGSTMYKNASYYGIKSIDKDWSKHAHLVYRFSNEEEVGLPFEYEETTRWGKSHTRLQIQNNIRELQRWLQAHNKSY